MSFSLIIIEILYFIGPRAYLKDQADNRIGSFEDIMDKEYNEKQSFMKDFHNTDTSIALTQKDPNLDNSSISHKP